MKIPDTYKGLFFGPENGAASLFLGPEDFLRFVPTDNTGVFYIGAAYVDLANNGYSELGDELIERAKTIWPGLPWDDHRQYLLDFVQRLHSLEYVDYLPEQLYEELKERFMTDEMRVPSGFKCWFLPMSSYEVAFSQPVGIVQMHLNYQVIEELYLILIGLALNNCQSLYDQIVGVLENRGLPVDNVEIVKNYALSHRDDPQMEEMVKALFAKPKPLRVIYIEL